MCVFILMVVVFGEVFVEIFLEFMVFGGCINGGMIDLEGWIWIFFDLDGVVFELSFDVEFFFWMFFGIKMV